MAGGLELALWCDLRVIEETAVMGVFCRRYEFSCNQLSHNPVPMVVVEYLTLYSLIHYFHRFGVPLIDGGTVRLPAMVGLGRALDLILTGRPIKAQEAFDWGLATKVVSCGTGRFLKALLT